MKFRSTIYRDVHTYFFKYQFSLPEIDSKIQLNKVNPNRIQIY